VRRVYHALLMLQTGGRGLRSTLPGGEIVRALPEHRHLSWNADEYAAFRAVVGPGAVALDIGANVGAYSLVLGRWVGASGAVYAFEPSPQAFAGLLGHVELNALSDVIRPIHAAVAATAGTAPLVLARTSGESRLAVGSDLASSTIDVPVTTVDHFCEEQRLDPSFIKIDVEGFELAVLKGARQTIRRIGSRLALFVEMHPSVWPALGMSVADVRAELESQGLEAVPLARTDDMWSDEGVCLRLVHH
jgi:FkbM family methyltransferase